MAKPEQKVAAAEVHETFRGDGFLSPTPLFTRAQCSLVLGHIQHGNPPAPSKWIKGQAVTDPLIFNLATRPRLLATVRMLLGEDIVLWGANWLVREPWQVHPWHSDIESCAAEGGFVSVWAGIENTSRESALQLIRGSHMIGKTIQQVAHEHSFRRGEADPATVLQWAREAIPAAEFAQPEMSDGDALIFDGRLWHGSENTRADGTRTALLFQYVVAGRRVQMPDFDHLEWPFRYKHTRVPLLAVSGKSRRNGVVTPPSEDVDVMSSQFHAMAIGASKDAVARWQAHHLFAGETRNVERMSVHYSTLAPGHSPHPPHAHREEEVLVVIDGEAELVIGRNDNGGEPHHERLSPGNFVYYPAFQFHTIRNCGSKRVTYLMLKWAGAPLEEEEPLEWRIWRGETVADVASHGLATNFLFEGPTHYLSKLHGHLTQVQPGGGYKPHTDTHDVAIVTLSGTVRTAGRNVGRNHIIYFPGGAVHGMENRASETARYLVFEFHGPSDENGLLRAGGRQRWRRPIRRVYRRLRQKATATRLWKRLRPIYHKFR